MSKHSSSLEAVADRFGAVELDGDLSRVELAEAFEGLRVRAGQRALVILDRDVALYLAADTRAAA